MNYCPALILAALTGVSPAADYVVAVSEKTKADEAWQPVLAKLAAKHPGAVTVSWKAAPEEILPALRKEMPRHTCFVATREEASREFVQKVHRFTRKLDDDPFTDTRWGILAGHDAGNALAIAAEEKPLTIHSAGSGTELAMDRIESGTWYCELKKGHMVQKDKGGGAAAKSTGPDTTKALVDLINAGPDLWVTSGHATERDWMIGFRCKNGFWKSKDGRLYGEDTDGGTWDVKSPNPKVYLPIGNCLMGHIDGPDAMALAFMKSATVRQMAGYVQPTWYGYQGWGLLDYFVEQPGRYTLTEAFHANNIALVHRLMTEFPGAEKIELVDEMGRPPRFTKVPQPAGRLTSQDMQGLLFDRDNVAFYGDPAWEARMAPGKLNWEQTLTEKDGAFTLTVTPLAGEATWQPVNKNGSQRGGRPILQWLPRRIDPAKVKITAGAEWKPVIADDFMLIPLPESATGPMTVIFSAE
ncbi:MAG: hypothetical protein ACKV19_27050 [Verrucomicrobiales bacterium]